MAVPLLGNPVFHQSLPELRGNIRVIVVHMGAYVLRKLVPDLLFTCLPLPRMFWSDSVTPTIQKSSRLPQ